MKLTQSTITTIVSPGKDGQPPLLRVRLTAGDEHAGATGLAADPEAENESASLGDDRRGNRDRPVDDDGAERVREDVAET